MAEIPSNELEASASEAPQQPESQEEGRIPYERFKAVNDELNAIKGQLAKIQQAKEESDRAALEEQERYKELWEQSKTELETEKIERLRLQVASEAGMDPKLVGRIQGNTREEMESDVKTLMEFLKPKEGPGVPAPSKASQPTDLDISKMTPEEIRNNRVKLLKQATVS